MQIFFKSSFLWLSEWLVSVCPKFQMGFSGREFYNSWGFIFVISLYCQDLLESFWIEFFIFYLVGHRISRNSISTFWWGEIWWKKCKFEVLKSKLSSIIELTKDYRSVNAIPHQFGNNLQTFLSSFWFLMQSIPIRLAIFHKSEQKGHFSQFILIFPWPHK